MVGRLQSSRSARSAGSAPTTLTRAYAVEPMNATSITPPNGSASNFCGSPLVYSVSSPLSGSTRQISPAAGWGTYSAPPGPTVLPEPAPPGKAASNSGSPGSPTGGAALAERARSSPRGWRGRPAACVEDSYLSPPSGRNRAWVGSHDEGVGDLHVRSYVRLSGGLSNPPARSRLPASESRRRSARESFPYRQRRACPPASACLPCGLTASQWDWYVTPAASP